MKKFFKIAVMIFIIFLIIIPLQAKNAKIALMDTTKNYQNISIAIRNIISKNLGKKGLTLIDASSYIESYINNADLSEKEKIVKIGIASNLDIIIIINISKIEKNYIANIRIYDIKNERIIDAWSFNIIKLKSEELNKISEMIAVSVTKEVKIFESDSQNHLFTNFIYATPLNYFEEVASYGMGINFSLAFEDYIYPHSYFSIDAGYIRFGGKDIHSHHSYMIPVTASIGYSFNYRKLFAIPTISIGAVYDKVYYIANATGEIKDTTNFNPLGKVGFILAYKYYYSYINVEANYNKILFIEEDKTFITYSAGLSIFF